MTDEELTLPSAKDEMLRMMFAAMWRGDELAPYALYAMIAHEPQDERDRIYMMLNDSV